MVGFGKLRKSPGRRATDMTNPWLWIVIAMLAGILMTLCAVKVFAEPITPTSYNKDVRYFRLLPTQVKGHYCILLPTGDNLPLTGIKNTMVHATFDNGDKLVGILFDRKMKETVYEETGETEFNSVVMEYFHLTECFVSRTLAGAIEKFPELGVPIEYEMDGITYTKSRIDYQGWAIKYVEYIEMTE